MKSSATLIGEEEGDHDDDRDTLNTPSKNKTIPLSNDRDMNEAHDEDHTILNAKVARDFNGGIVKLKLESSSTDGQATVDVERNIGERG